MGVGGGLGGQHKDILLSTTFLADPISSAYLCHAWRRRSLAIYGDVDDDGGHSLYDGDDDDDDDDDEVAEICYR